MQTNQSTNENCSSAMNQLDFQHFVKACSSPLADAQDRFEMKFAAHMYNTKEPLLPQDYSLAKCALNRIRTLEGW